MRGGGELCLIDSALIRVLIFRYNISWLRFQDMMAAVKQVKC